MIPLAQYLSDARGEDFAPFRPLGERRALQTVGREAGWDADTHEAPVKPVFRTVRAATARPAAEVLAPAEVAAGTKPLPRFESDRRSREADEAAFETRLKASVEAARQDALAEGKAAGRADAEAEGAERLEALRKEMLALQADALSAARDQWTTAEGDRLADLIILQMAVFEDAMKANVRNILRPLATEARQRQAMDELAEAVKTLAVDAANVKIAASGPRDLLSKLRDKLGEHSQKLVLKPDETRVDLRVEADTTTIETRLSSWGQALEKALS